MVLADSGNDLCTRSGRQEKKETGNGDAGGMAFDNSVAIIKATEKKNAADAMYDAFGRSPRRNEI